MKKIIKSIVFSLCFVCLSVYPVIGNGQTESLVYKDVRGLITDAYYTQSQSLLICTISSNLDEPVCATIEQYEQSASSETAPTDFYSELLCYGRDGELIFKRQFNEGAEGIHALQICGELTDGSILVKNRELGHQASSKDDFFLISGEGDCFPLQGQLQELMENNHTWIKGDRIFAQSLEAPHTFSLWQMDTQHVPHPIFENCGNEETTRMWGNDIVWGEDFILVYGLVLSGSQKEHGALCMLDLSGNVLWNYTDKRELCVITDALVESEGIMISLRHLNDPQSSYSWQLMNFDDGTLLEEGTRSFDVQSTLVHEENGMQLQYCYIDDGFSLRILKDGQEAEQIALYPESVGYMVNMKPRIMEIEEGRYLMVFSLDHRQLHGKDGWIALFIQ